MGAPTNAEIKARIQAAVTVARQKLGTSGYNANVNADRAGAYLTLARTLLSIYKDTGGKVVHITPAAPRSGAVPQTVAARPDASGTAIGGDLSIFHAAETLLIQAQITTYSVHCVIIIKSGIYYFVDIMRNLEFVPNCNSFNVFAC